MYCSITRSCIAIAKISVMLMLRPSASDRPIAGMPSSVAGILTMRLGRSTRSQKVRAIATVPSVSCDSDGGTSMLTNPSAPAVRSWTGRRMSAACWMSVIASSVKMSCGSSKPSASSSRIWSSYIDPSAIAFWKIVGLLVIPVTLSSAIMRCSSPDVSRSRLMKSSQTDCPCSPSRCSGVVIGRPPRTRRPVGSRR